MLRRDHQGVDDQFPLSEPDSPRFRYSKRTANHPDIDVVQLVRVADVLDLSGDRTVRWDDSNPQRPLPDEVRSNMAAWSDASVGSQAV
jgi:hypothetical protein